VKIIVKNYHSETFDLLFLLPIVS